MKKLYTTLIAITILTVTAYGMYGVLTGSSTNGMSKTCYYSVGGSTETLTISSSENCPVSHDF
jgi:hypothetical protein